MSRNYEVISNANGSPIKAWVRGVQVEEDAKAQLERIASLPFIYRWIAVMPDVHLGSGVRLARIRN